MSQFHKYKYLTYGLGLVATIAFSIEIARDDIIGAVLLAVIAAAFIMVLFLFYREIYTTGIKTKLDISRVLGKDAKEALTLGEVGILTYNDEYLVTWASPYFTENGLDVVNKKLTTWMPDLKKMFSEEVDTITASKDGQIYDIVRKPDAKILYVKNVTRLYELEKSEKEHGIVVGIMELDNYMEYQSYEDEELMARINTHLRTRLVAWGKKNGMLMRRLRSDRFFLVLDRQILAKVRAENLPILQEIKDEAARLDVSITLSMAFAYGTTDFLNLDNMVNELIELAQARSGDQAAIRSAAGQVEFVGGNSELSTQRSKVRVRVMAQSIEEAIRESPRVFVAGHVNTDFDCMGAALAMAKWAKSLGKPAYVVLKDVPRDAQLQMVMDHYEKDLQERGTFLSPEEAEEMMDRDRDLLLLVDHSVPAISSAKNLLPEAQRILIIDHHRRSDQFVDHPMLSYIESSASSSCELITELLQNVPNPVPIYEAEATIMYLGIIVDTNHFTMHTGSRTFETAGELRSWGANSALADKALCESKDYFMEKNRLISQAQAYADRFMILESPEAISRTMMAQMADTLLKIRGIQAAFVISRVDGQEGSVAVSARSDGSFNVQKVMEKMQGGGHFAAAALCRKNTTTQAIRQELTEVLDEEEAGGANPA